MPKKYYYRKYMKVPQTNHKNTNNPNEKWAKDKNTYFTEET